MRDNREITNIIANDFGANATYVEDLLRQFQHNPHSVGEEWGEYFQTILGEPGPTRAESRPVNGAASPTAAATAQVGAVTAKPAPAAETAAAGERMQIRGPALRIVENMEASLTVPTATSARQIQVKLLDENRRWINRHREAQGKS